MKIKHKVVTVFILSIFISVIVFSVTVYALLNKGYFSGLSPREMNQVLEEMTESLKKEKLFSKESANAKEAMESLECLKEFLSSEEVAHSGMEFEILMEDGTCIMGQEKRKISSIEELVEALSQNENYGVSQWVAAKKIEFNGQNGYLINCVDKTRFKTITYYFNGPKAKGVLGKIVLLGLFITIIISSLFTYLFMKGTMKRVTTIYEAIAQFELGNLQLRIADKRNDELGKVAERFNEMAEKIEGQVNEKAEYEEKRKQLISNISHDLRTPLSSVVGYSELLFKGGNSEAEVKKYAEIINRKALYMEKLLKQLLEFARLENGSFKLNMQEGDITELIREILIEYLPTIEKESIELNLNLPKQSIYLKYDQERMERVIRNLLDNALKYGMEAKRLDVTVYKKEKDVIIEVQDFGRGMNEETVKHIFDRFYRGEKGRGTKSGGMGLGLAISKEIIKQHHGTITASSQMNQGTKMKIVLTI